MFASQYIPSSNLKIHAIDNVHFDPLFRASVSQGFANVLLCCFTLLVTGYVIATRINGAELCSSSFHDVRTTHNAPDSMIRICARATFRSSTTLKWPQISPQRFFSCTQWRREDPRLDGSGRKITDEFAEMREKYSMLSHPKVTRTEVNSYQILRYVLMTIE
jgi:hypothetical protein